MHPPPPPPPQPTASLIARLRKIAFTYTIKSWMQIFVHGLKHVKYTKMRFDASNNIDETSRKKNIFWFFHVQIIAQSFDVFLLYFLSLLSSVDPDPHAAVTLIGWILILVAKFTHKKKRKKVKNCIVLMCWMLS